jgi:ABC-type sugar transport system substrate-binding protein
MGAVGALGMTGLAGCAGGGSGEKNVIAFPMKGLDAFFFRSVVRGAESRANELGYEFEFSGADQSSEELNRQISDFAARGDVAAIITDPVDSEAQQGPIDDALESGIPVAVADTPPADRVTFEISFDNYEAGRVMARQAADTLAQSYESLEGVKVVHFHGFLGSYAWNQRMQGVLDEMEEIVAETGLDFYNVEGGGSPEEFGQSADEWISQNRDVACVLQASSGGFFTGSMRALNREDLLWYRGEDNHVVAGAIDGYLSDVKWIEDGLIDFITMQNAISYGEIAVSVLDEYAIGSDDVYDAVPTGVVPEGVDVSRYYFGDVLGEEPSIEMHPTFGPSYTVPTYNMTPENVDHPKHWAKIAQNDLGMEEAAAGLQVDPQGTPP